MMLNCVKDSVKRGCLTLMRRSVFYFMCIVLIPLGMTAFFVSLLDRGVAEHVPSAVIDLDHSEMSRTLTRTLSAMQAVDIQYKLNSYTEAMDYLKQNKIIGFYLIPENFGNDAIAGRQPELTYYINFGYFVPGSLLIKGYTTTSMLANGALIQNTLSAHGVEEMVIKPALQPFVNDVHELNNPWMNYGIYLANSFASGVFSLMVVLVSCYVIVMEIKHESSQEWLSVGGGSVSVAIFGSLAPLTILFTLVGWLMQIILFGIAGYPMNGSLWALLLALFLLVIACQSLAVIACGIAPNPRYALSICSLVSVLAFSLGGYSFPVEDMYPGVAIFSYILPMRYYFLIYIDQALNGIGFVFSRYYYAALLTFPLVSLLLLPRLKRAMAKPIVYIP